MAPLNISQLYIPSICTVFFFKTQWRSFFGLFQQCRGWKLSLPFSKSSNLKPRFTFQMFRCLSSCHARKVVQSSLQSRYQRIHRTIGWEIRFSWIRRMSWHLCEARSKANTPGNVIQEKPKRSRFSRSLWLNISRNMAISSRSLAFTRKAESSCSGAKSTQFEEIQGFVQVFWETVVSKKFSRKDSIDLQVGPV